MIQLPDKKKNIGAASLQIFGENPNNPVTWKHFRAVGYDYYNRIEKQAVTQRETLQKARNYLNDIQSFVNLSYGNTPAVQSQNLQKTDAPVLSSTTGFYNDVFGRNVWEQINNEANAFGILRKIPWDISGWRVLTTAGATSGGGVTENAAVPDTIKPTLATVSHDPKTVATAFNVSAVEQKLSLTRNDVVQDAMSFMREYSGREHIKLINRMLLKDVDTLASNNLESIDRAISSNAEQDNCGITAGDSDIFGLDRSSASWADAYVNHNSGTDRDFSLSLLDTLFTNTRPYKTANDPYVILTGYDTLERIQQEANNKVRFAQYPEKAVKPSVNGITDVVEPGVDVGFQATLYKGVPIIASNDVPQDTISRVYLINLNHLMIKTLMPTQYYQTGLLGNGDPFGINLLADEGLYVTMAELYCTNFRVQAKLRDLQ